MQPRTDSAFCLAILATSYNAFGKAKKNHALSKASKFMYFQAISRIQKSLQDPVDSCSDETLLATMVLSFYEVSRYTVSHLQFAAEQVQLTSWEHHGGKDKQYKKDELSKLSGR